MTCKEDRRYVEYLKLILTQLIYMYNDLCDVKPEIAVRKCKFLNKTINNVIVRHSFKCLVCNYVIVL